MTQPVCIRPIWIPQPELRFGFRTGIPSDIGGMNESIIRTDCGEITAQYLCDVYLYRYER